MSHHSRMEILWEFVKQRVSWNIMCKKLNVCVCLQVCNSVGSDAKWGMAFLWNEFTIPIPCCYCCLEHSAPGKINQLPGGHMHGNNVANHLMKSLQAICFPQRLILGFLALRLRVTWSSDRMTLILLGRLTHFWTNIEEVLQIGVACACGNGSDGPPIRVLLEMKWIWTLSLRKCQGANCPKNSRDW